MNKNFSICRSNHFSEYFNIQRVYSWKIFLWILSERLKNVLNTSWKRLEDVMKTSWRRVNKKRLTLWYILKTSWRRLENVFKILLRHVCKASRRRFKDVLARHLIDVFKTSSRHFQSVFKTSRRYLENVWLRWIYSSWSRRLQDVLKTSSEDIWPRQIYATFEDEDKRRLEDVFRWLHQNKCVLGSNYLR